MIAGGISQWVDEHTAEVWEPELNPGILQNGRREPTLKGGWHPGMFGIQHLHKHTHTHTHTHRFYFFKISTLNAACCYEPVLFSHHPIFLFPWAQVFNAASNSLKCVKTQFLDLFFIYIILLCKFHFFSYFFAWVNFPLFTFNFLSSELSPNLSLILAWLCHLE